MLKKMGIGLAALIATVPGIYLLFIRPWHQRWGATDEEMQRVERVTAQAKPVVEGLQAK